MMVAYHGLCRVKFDSRDTCNNLWSSVHTIFVINHTVVILNKSYYNRVKAETINDIAYQFLADRTFFGNSEQPSRTSALLIPLGVVLWIVLYSPCLRRLGWCRLRKRTGPLLSFWNPILHIRWQANPLPCHMRIRHSNRVPWDIPTVDERAT